MPDPFHYRGILKSSLMLFAIAIIILTSSAVVTSQGNDRIQDNKTRTDELIVSGWTFPWDNSSWTSLKGWTSELDEASPYWYYANENGTVSNSHERTEDLEYIIHCRSNGMKIIPMISNNHDVDVVSNIITNITVRDIHIQALLNIAIINGWEGIDINYENIPSALNDEFSDFIYELSRSFHQKNKVVYVSVFPKVADDEIREGPGAYDYRAIGEYADCVRVMAYNLHWSSAPMSGPVTSFDWVRTVMDYSVDAIPTAKISLGIPLFGYDWEIDRAEKALNIADNRSFEYISDLIQDPGIDRQWNGTSRTPFLKYTTPSGRLHAIHYNDAESLLHELVILRDLDINRISLWRIGDEDPQVREYVAMVKEKGLSDLPPYVNIGYDTEGMKGSEMVMGPVRAYDIDGVVVDVQWDFGDGEQATLIDPIHTFEKGGKYTSSLRISDNGGNIVIKEKEVTVGPYPFFEMIGQPGIDEKFQLDASESWDLGSIISFNWDLGDGNYLFHAGPFVEHSYSHPGSFNIILTVMNDRGYTDTRELLVIIDDLEDPFVSAGSDMSVWEDMEIQFDGRGSNDNSGSLSLQWIFHDNSTQEGPFASYLYEEPGMYQVTLLGRDSSNRTSADMIQVRVKDRTAPVVIVSHPEVVELGEMIEIDASESHDNVGITEVKWRLPGGKTVSGNFSIDHFPTSAGRYHFTIDILDEQGNWNSTSFFVDVRDMVSPEVEFYIDPAPPLWNETYLSEIEFNDVWDLSGVDHIFVVNVTYRFLITRAEDGSGIGYINWTFGDGEKAHGGSVYHNYSQAGYYEINLTVSDIYGNSIFRDLKILVIPTVNFTVNEIQPYQEVVEILPLPEKEENNRIIPISIGMISVVIISIILFLFLLYESILVIKHMNRRFHGGGKT